MILFLFAAVGVIGWLLTTDWGWGSTLLEEVHEISVNVTLVAIGLHVAAAIYESFHHRENLIRAMVTGYKRRCGVVSLLFHWIMGLLIIVQFMALGGYINDGEH